MKITKKKTVLIVIIIAIIGIVIWMLSNPSKKNEIAFDTAIVTKRDISNSVTATGRARYQGRSRYSSIRNHR